MATKYISSITLPNGDVAQIMDKTSGYTSNTGTVTSVTASGALSSSGGTTPAITHNAPSTSPAKSTQAVYPITVDSYGHILTAGSEVTIPSQNDSYLPRNLVSSGTNLNTITIPGCYTLSESATYTNSPKYGVAATLSIIKDSNTTIEQTFKAEDNSVHTYIRFSTDSGSTWTDWRQEAGLETFDSWSSGSHDADNASAGMIFCRSGSSYTTNLPGDASYGFLMTMGNSSSNKQQFYTEYTSSGTTGF